MATRRRVDEESAEFQLLDLHPGRRHESRAGDDSDEEDGVGFDSKPKLGRCTRCLNSVIRTSTCCCPAVVRSRCLAYRSLFFLVVAILVVVAVALGLGFYHIWDAYADTPRGGCLRDERTMNTFRYILRSFEEVASEHKIEYWADFGVLLGGSQRGDVLPWDRDIDISMLASTLPLLREAHVRAAFKARGIIVCPVRKCLKPAWTEHNWPEIDINLWEIDGPRVRYWRSEAEKNDPIREVVFSKYNDFDLALLYPLTRLTIGTVSMPVPGRYKDVLRVRYPHSYGISLPYNPRCWWAAVTQSLPAASSLAIYQPPEIHEMWGVQKVARPGEPPVQFLFDWSLGHFVANPEWIEWTHHQAANFTRLATGDNKPLPGAVKK